MMNVALLLALTVGAPALKDKAAPAPSLQGEWQVKSRTDRGQPSTDQNCWIFAPGGSAEIRDPTGRVASTLTYTVASDGKLKTLDFYEAQGNGRADLRQAIYKIDGDTMTISWTLGNTPRPTSFEPANDHYVIVLERARRKD
jgi:uncharacterized protein (TIGR03067 family)